MKGILEALLFLHFSVFGNMANPLQKGTILSSAFGTDDINILSERIQIDIDSAFRRAAFEVEYHIHSDQESESILLAFLSADYEGGFQVYLDSQKVDSISMSREALSQLSGMPLEDENIYLRFGKYESHPILRKNLIFFEIPVEATEHLITVKYFAKPWKDAHGFLNKISFRYSLYPAKYWKSFTDLKISVSSPLKTTSNFGLPNRIENGKEVWEFEQLPGDYFIIEKLQEPNSLVSFLIWLNPLRIGAIFYFGLIVFHCFLIRKWLTQGHRLFKLWPFIYRIGLVALLFDFVAYLTCILSYPLIDALLGDMAHGRHGALGLLMLGVFVLWLLPFRLILISIYTNIVAKRLRK